MKTIIFENEVYKVYGRKESRKNPNPHISIASSDITPIGKQRSILIAYLIANGINPIKTATTHWCVNRVLRMDSAGIDTSITKKETWASVSNLLAITEANIEAQDTQVQSSNNYGEENRIIHDVLNTFPLNNDLKIISMKIALIDVTNSTHLSQYKSLISLPCLAGQILSISDFDLRLAKGDPDLVNIIARNTGAINLFSFASKYCTYHNVEVYQRDDYSVYDGVVRKILPQYKQDISEARIERWRTSYNYGAFNNCIGELLDEHNIHIPFRRRKFDYFLWYINRKA